MVLALLHLFQGFVHVDVLRVMGDPDAPWCLDAVRALTREEGIMLLDRAVVVGLLATQGGGYYSIHPASTLYLRDLFEMAYPAASGTAEHTHRAFVEAMGALGDYYAEQYEQGNRGVLQVLAAEEDNLLAALRLARAHGWWWSVTSAMQGLRHLYLETGRLAAWRRLVETVVPDFVDAATDGPLPGREEDWSLVSEYRVRLARWERRWQDAERLQRMRVDWERERARPALAAAPETRSASQRNAIRSMARCLYELTGIEREQDDPACNVPGGPQVI
jgi:hypothetical protein